MSMYSYDEVLADVRHVYEQLTGLPAPKVDVKSPKFPLPAGVDPVAYVQREIDYLNLYLVHSGIATRVSRAPSWAPTAEVYETPKEYAIVVELAGVPADDVEVVPQATSVTVRGTRNFRRASEDARYLASDRTYGAFERHFAVPPGVHVEKMRSEIGDGLLTITFPKTDAGQSRKHAGHDQSAQQKSGGEKKAR
jgi:HSP20 family molecular chaperone IbpA